MDNIEERHNHPAIEPGDELVALQTVLTDAEGQILCDLLNSGGIDAMLNSGTLAGYGINIAFHGGAGEILVHARDLEEARNFVRLWQTPLLEESEEPVEDA